MASKKRSNQPDKQPEKKVVRYAVYIALPNDQHRDFAARAARHGTCTSFGTDSTSQYRVIGTEGSVYVDPGYELASGLELHIRQDTKERTIKLKKRDPFAPELVYFSDCILHDRDPEPSGEEGLADVRVIRALYKSAKRNRPVRLAPQPPRRQPTRRQEITRPPVRRRPMVHATPPSG